MDFYTKFKLTCAVVATIGLYSILYRENKFYRLCEHIFVGLAAGWSIVALWTETLYDQWWVKMTGTVAEAGSKAIPGYWLYIMLLPLGLMGYFVFSKKHNWISRIPIGIIIGLWSGQQPSAWWTRYGPQIADSMKPIIPTTFERFTQPNTASMLDASNKVVAMPADLAHRLDTPVYFCEAVGNIVFLITLLSVISYFLFSMDLKNKALKSSTTLGRWLLMVGFGAIFGSTVMMRFTLLIDRMYFVWIEWLKMGILGR